MFEVALEVGNNCYPEYHIFQCGAEKTVLRSCYTFVPCNYMSSPLLFSAEKMQFWDRLLREHTKEEDSLGLSRSPWCPCEHVSILKGYSDWTHYVSHGPLSSEPESLSWMQVSLIHYYYRDALTIIAVSISYAIVIGAGKGLHDPMGTQHILTCLWELLAHSWAFSISTGKKKRIAARHPHSFLKGSI